MRTKEKIVQVMEERTTAVGNNYKIAQVLGFVVEVLIDIRDILNKKK